MDLDPELQEADEGRRGPALKPVGSRPAHHALSVATSLVAVLVAIAILKPWGPGSAPAPPRVPRTALPVLATPTPRPTNESADGLAAPICLGAGAWQVASLETWRTQRVRVWRAVEPIADAVGPLDPAIPTVPVVALEIEALGWCAPTYGADRPAGPARVTAWFVLDAIAVELQLRQVLPERGTTQVAALYRLRGLCPPGPACPTTPTAVTEPWRTGRVVFRYEDLGGDRVAWFAADIEILVPAAGPDGSPSAAAGRRGTGLPQRSRGSWSISYVARARMTSPIPASHRPGIRVTMSAGSANWNALTRAASSTTR